jgi:hypothetical protein
MKTSKNRQPQYVESGIGQVSSANKSNAIAKDLDPGIILQSIDNEEISVTINGKRKLVRKAEIEFRELFQEALKGDLRAASLISNMSANYLGPEQKGPSSTRIVVEQGDSPLHSESSVTAKKSQLKTGSPAKPSARAKKSILSTNDLFQKVAREKIEISMRGRTARMTRMEAYLRQLQIMARKDLKASRLLIKLRKQFPGPLAEGDPIVIVLSENQARY